MEASSSSSSSSAASASKAPLHVVMAMPAGEQYKLNPRVKRDFITRRAAAYKINTNPNSVWANVKEVERALIQCCEIPEDMSEDALSGPEPFSSGRTGVGYIPLLGGGALEKDKEIRFLGIVAKDCRTLASRSLALGILERTLDMHLFEMEEAEERRVAKRPDNDDNDEPVEDDKKVTGENDIEEDNEGTIDDTELDQKRRSTQQSKPVPKYKRTKRKLDEDVSQDVVKEMTKSHSDKWGRLEKFLAGGGLKVLKRWLQEGLEDEIVVKKPTSDGTNKKSKKPPEDVTILQTSSTRALILPILQFLERIPFDKDYVVESKINKQIRNIEKRIDSLLKARTQGDHESDDLEGWIPGKTTTTTKNDTDGLQAVKDAIKNLKKTWQENTKRKGEGFQDPFKDLTGTLRERLAAVRKYEAGQAPRPEWMVVAEVESKAPQKKKSRVELAAKERQMEVMIENQRTEARRKELEQARKVHAENLKRLREKMQANAAATIEKKSGGKRIKWKDGLISKDHRDRKTLEEVFVFNHKAPANKDMTEILQDEKHPSKTLTRDTLEQEEHGGEDMDSGDTIDLTLD